MLSLVSKRGNLQTYSWCCNLQSFVNLQPSKRDFPVVGFSTKVHSLDLLPSETCRLIYVTLCITWGT